jgi:fructokinase
VIQLPDGFDLEAPGPGLVVAVGELLWDQLPTGSHLGGAPFNVLAHLQRFGFEAEIVTAVGDDPAGRRALVAAQELGVGTGYVRVAPAIPTGTVEVQLDAKGTPAYVIRSPVAYERASLSGADLGAISARRPVALIFGTLAQRFPSVRAATRDLAVHAPAALRVYDVNLRAGAWTPGLVRALLAEARLLKLNDDEVSLLGPALGLPSDSPASFAQAVVAQGGVELVCVTRGRNGAELFSRVGAVAAPGIEVPVADTVGAGDAFTAGLVAAILQGRSLDDALGQANRLGALVASRPGAIPSWTPEELPRVQARE